MFPLSVGDPIRSFSETENSSDFARWCQKKKFGAKHLYTDYREMLANPELEAVSVTTMWDQHAAPTLAAIRAGKHVFLEKPRNQWQQCRPAWRPKHLLRPAGSSQCKISDRTPEDRIRAIVDFKLSSRT